ncbi:MAG: hypothetical protein KQI35_01770 [Bacteroidetes bacterium]|nr:hypothetical protein [Bacteroidota bacterium]
MVGQKERILKCPFCESDNVVIMKRPGWAIVGMIILLGIPIPWLKKSYFCFDCRKEWKGLSK